MASMKVKEFKSLLMKTVSPSLTKEEASYFVQEVVETDIRKPHHGKYDTGLLKDLTSWKGKTSTVKKTIDLPGYTQYDFGGLGPSLKLKEIHDDLENKAKSNGISMVSIINSGGMHIMHLWVQGLAKRGIFAIAGWNGGPDAVIPFNGTRGILGTNPIAFGFPGDLGDIVIDMATSEIPYFKIVDAKKNKTTLPPNAAVDNSGVLTTDPAKALDSNDVSNLVPMGGGYKGYNINYLVEIMTSALVGARISAQMSNAYIEPEHGGFIIAIAIDKVTDRSSYDTSVKTMNDKIRSQQPKPGVDHVEVPGDRNLSRKKAFTDNTEIEVHDEYHAALLELSK